MSRPWRVAYESLSRVDRAPPLAAEDLELLARAANMLGLDDDYVGGLERAHRAYRDAGEARAGRCGGPSAATAGSRGRARP